jgi:opacity protein-like surface antigen
MREAVFLAGLAAIAAAGPAAAQSGLGPERSSAYFAPDLNLVRLGMIQTGGVAAREAIGGGIGYDFGNGLKAELASLNSRPAAERNYVPTIGSISSTTVMLRGLYSFNEGSSFSPYVGAAFGIIDVTRRLGGFQSNDWVAAYQLRGGVKLSISQKLLGSFEYQWTEGDKPHFSVSGISTKVEFPSHGFLVGMNYKFF